MNPMLWLEALCLVVLLVALVADVLMHLHTRRQRKEPTE